MKWCTFNKFHYAVVFLLTTVFGSSVVCAENLKKEEMEQRHDRNLQRYKHGWSKLIPQYQKIQYAGSMGLISFGVGWDYGKKEQWETDLFLGYLPRFDGKQGHATITLKENYIPWKLKIGSGKWMAEPFTVSLYMNKIFGDEFWSREPDKYPDGYYGLATNLRFNLSFGQRISMRVRPIGLSDNLTFFYEFGTNDLYIISYATNKYLRFTDIFNLSLGIKLKFL